MKKIINRKVYNTETAKKVAEKSFGDGRSPSYWSEVLYRKVTGEFFLYGEGGAMTKYAERLDDSHWGAGRVITPLSYEAAKIWAEKNMPIKDFAILFGVVSE